MAVAAGGKDFYAVLGVPQNATDDVIKKAYRDLAFKNHPDRNPNDPAAEQRFKEVSEAYQTLSNPQKRAEYDTFGNTPPKAPPGSGFSSTGRYGQPPNDWVEFDPFEFAREETIREMFTRMGANNPYGRNVNQQLEVHGRIVLKLRDILLGKSEEVEVTVSEDQFRDGEFNRLNHKFKVPVKIPPGLRGGNVIQTNVTLPTGVKQTLNILVDQEYDPKYEVAPNGDLHSNLYITYPQAILGGTCTIELIDGRKEKIKIRENTQAGQRVRIAEQGLPKSLRDTKRGDLYFMIHVDIPRVVTPEQKRCLEDLQKLFEQQAPGKSS